MCVPALKWKANFAKANSRKKKGKRGSGEVMAVISVVLHETIMVSCKTRIFWEVRGVTSPGALVIPEVSWGN